MLRIVASEKIKIAVACSNGLLVIERLRLGKNKLLIGNIELVKGVFYCAEDHADGDMLKR